MKLSGISNKGLKRIAQFTSPDEGVFKLEELSDAAKQHALERYAEDATQDSYWYESVIANAKEDAPPYFIIDEIQFSGFWSQGDGASWGGSVDFLKWCEAHGNELGVSLIKGGQISARGAVSLPQGNYNHSGGMGIEPDDYTDYPEDLSDVTEIPGAESAEDEMLTEVLDEAKDYANTVYRDLESEYEYQTSEEVFKDMVDANEWMFDAEGNIV